MSWKCSQFYTKMFIFTTFFFSCLMRGGRFQIPLLAGHQRPASETPFKWRFAGGPMMAKHWMPSWYLFDFKGIRTSIAKEPYIFVIFFRGGGFWTPCPPSGSVHEVVCKRSSVHWLGTWHVSSQAKGTKSKKGGKDQESIQSSTTPDPGYHMGKW